MPEYQVKSKMKHIVDSLDRAGLLKTRVEGRGIAYSITKEEK